MKIANIADEACILLEDGKAFRVAQESEGRFGPGMKELFRDWTAFLAWAGDHTPTDPFDWQDGDLGTISPEAGQVFAIGLNYDEHSRETGLGAGKDFPPVFPKWPSSLCAPFQALAVPGESHIDWEVELVVVIAKGGRHIAREDVASHIAGYAIGQDFSDRKLQFVGDAPQFGLAKSGENFSPVGPCLVTPDEFGEPGSKAISCEVDGVVKQSGSLDQMIFPVDEIVAFLSTVVELRPGDVIFTGTPSGVGFARKPQEFLNAGSEIVSRIEGLGEIRQTIVSR